MYSAGLTTTPHLSTTPTHNTLLMQVDLDLILRLLQYICGEGPFSNPQAQKDAQPGAVLIFLPGWDEISRLKELLERDQAFRRTHSG